VIPKVLITLMALWTLGTLLWLIGPSWAPDQLITLAKTSLASLQRRTGQLWTTEQVRASDQSQVTHRSAAEDHRSRSSDQASSSDQSNPRGQLTTGDGSVSVANRPGHPASTLRPVYETTAEQLYQDYSANVVAIQTRIGASLVRLSGNIAEIDLDVTGRPVVKLWTSKDNSATMTLTEDQRGAAAQLTKGETVEIECDKIARRDASLEGSDCTLEFVDATPKQVNPALVLANNNGAARHSPSAVARTGARKKTPASSKGNAAMLAVTNVPPTALDANTEPESGGSAAAVPRLSGHRATNIHVASASDSDTGTVQEGYIGGSTTLTLRGGSRDTTSPGKTAIGSDDLAQVRAVDPQAADHIATYCSKSIVSPNNQDNLVTGCRRTEAEAWTRLVLKNEFPTLDDATRKKCNEPPFPDTYLAKERCARFELHMN
jgi:hypothetical protein